MYLKEKRTLVWLGLHEILLNICNFKEIWQGILLVRELKIRINYLKTTSSKLFLFLGIPNMLVDTWYAYI